MRRQAKRLLLVLQGFEDKLEFCPWLPSLLCCLLQALTEAEVYCVVLALVDRSLRPNTQPKLPHFLLTQQREELFELAFYDLASGFASAAVETLGKACRDGGGRLDYWRMWKAPFFATKLPLQSVLKIVDVWMSEGHKALFRIALVRALIL